MWANNMILFDFCVCMKMRYTQVYPPKWLCNACIVIWLCYVRFTMMKTMINHQMLGYPTWYPTIPYGLQVMSNSIGDLWFHNIPSLFCMVLGFKNGNVMTCAMIELRGSSFKCGDGNTLNSVWHTHYIFFEFYSWWWDDHTPYM